VSLGRKTVGAAPAGDHFMRLVSGGRGFQIPSLLVANMGWFMLTWV